MRQGGKIAGGNPSRGRVDNDYYATNTESTRALLAVEEIIYPALEPACGEGHISKLLDEKQTMSFDLIDRGYSGMTADFLMPDESLVELIKSDNKFWNIGNYIGVNTVITNPPFSLFQEFLEKSLRIAKSKVIMFGKLQALEGQKRATFLQTTPLRTVYVFKKRQQPLRNGKSNDEKTGKKMSSTMAFAWFVWEIGYKGKPTIEWI